MAKRFYVRLDTDYREDPKVKALELMAPKGRGREYRCAYIDLLTVWARCGGMVHLDNIGEYALLKNALSPWNDKKIGEFCDLLAHVELVRPLDLMERRVLCSKRSLDDADKARSLSEKRAYAGRKSGESRKPSDDSEAEK